MDVIVEKTKCTGCHACYSACPKNAITMRQDNMGFLYPQIDDDKCVDCGLCKASCPVLTSQYEKREPISYACFNKNESERMKSSSGGIFVLLASMIIQKGGVVFGAGFDKDFNVCHKFIDNENDIEQFMGSKYVQSTIGDTYKKAKEFLESDRYVLFSGTPCQIEGLKSYLKRDFEKLYTQDIICHGVPSPKAWQKYLEYQREKHGEDISLVSFRNKESGKSRIKVSFNTEKYYAKPAKDTFMLAFSKSICLRNSCYICDFKKANRNSDITIADFWGIDKVLPEINDNKGISLVIANTEKGKKLFDSIKEHTVSREVNLTSAVKYNPAFGKSAEKCENAEQFSQNIDKMPFDKLVKKYVPKTPFLLKVIYKAVDIIRS